ncbi:MAG: response regulator [Thermodesulfobacteriota bacterium]
MSKTILVIDDNKTIMSAFRFALEGTPYTLITTSKGGEGVACVRSKQIDLIYMDIEMEDASVVDTLREIRSHDKSVPIYIITPFEQKFMDMLLPLKSEGISFDLLNKPCNIDAITLITESVLDGINYLKGGFLK